MFHVLFSVLFLQAFIYVHFLEIISFPYLFGIDCFTKLNLKLNSLLHVLFGAYKQMHSFQTQDGVFFVSIFSMKSSTKILLGVI
jgi:hypothetical protein